MVGHAACSVMMESLGDVGPELQSSGPERHKSIAWATSLSSSSKWLKVAPITSSGPYHEAWKWMT